MPVVSNARLERQVQGSEIVNNRRTFEQLAGLLDSDARSLKLTALFKSSASGWDPATFHALCDNKGPTLTVVQGPGGSYYGGYTSVSWSLCNTFAPDALAFLFRCQSPATQSPEKFLRTGHNYEIYSHHSYGPTFGCKFDFFTFGAGGGQVFRQESYGGTPSFNLTGPLINDSGQNLSANYQLEVLQVGIIDSSTVEMSEPWSSGATWTHQVRIAPLCMVTLS